MAGSLNHIISEDGTFRMDLIENLGDAQEALEEAHQFVAGIARLWAGDRVVADVLERCGFPALKVMPVIQPELCGAESYYRALPIEGSMMDAALDCIKWAVDPQIPDSIAVVEGRHSIVCGAVLSKSLLTPCTCGARVVIYNLTPVKES